MRFLVTFTREPLIVDDEPILALPIIIEAHAMAIAMIPTQWIIYLATFRGSTSSQLTWRTYAFALVTWLNYCSSRAINWLAPNETHLVSYRSRLLKGNRNRSTVRRYLSTVIAFYQWSADRNLTDALHLTKGRVYRKRHGLLLHLGNNTEHQIPLILPRPTKRRGSPRFYDIDERKAILGALTPRDRLMAAWALFTGARRHEICALVRGQLPNQNSYRRRSYIQISLTVTKGSYPGTLFVPKWLVDQTYQHFISQSLSFPEGLERSNSPDSPLFLSARGTAVRGDTLYRAFKRTLKQLGIEGTFHDLRHTFAILTLDKLIRSQASATEYTSTLIQQRHPLLVLKTLMRHASIETTEIYLHARDIYLTSLLDDLWEMPDLSILAPDETPS